MKTRPQLSQNTEAKNFLADESNVILVLKTILVHLLLFCFWRIETNPGFVHSKKFGLYLNLPHIEHDVSTGARKSTL